MAAGADTIAVAAHPGWTATNLQRTVGIARVLNPLFAMEPWQGALPTLFAAGAEGAEGGGYYGPDGFYEMRGFPRRVGTTPEAADEETARKLWEVSTQLTGVGYEKLDVSA